MNIKSGTQRNKMALKHPFECKPRSIFLCSNEIRLTVKMSSGYIFH